MAGPRLERRPAILVALIVAAIGAGMLPASAAASSAGQLYGFGLNQYGELGATATSGTESPNPTPALINLPGASDPVTEIAAGGYHSLALIASGQLYAFGENRFGQLGRTVNIETENPNPAPTVVTLPGASDPVTEIAAGLDHSLALTSSGHLYAFGKNKYGQLGTATNSGTENPNPTPTLVSLPGASGPVSKIAAGGNHSLALTASGQLYAFGENYYGELGNAVNSGTANPSPTPTLVTLPGASGPVTQIAAGAAHTLALTSSGQLYAFGENLFGELGRITNSGTSTPNPTPALVTLPGASGPVTRIAAGAYHTLALTSSGQLYAFGENQTGELGSATNNGSGTPNPTPALVTLSGASGPVAQIAAGAYHSLALTSGGQLLAFGSNIYGQLGNDTNSGTGNPNPTPAPVGLPAGTTIDTIAPGPSANHTLAVIADLAVTSSALPSGQVGVPYGATASAEGGTAPYAWQASGLPAGLSIDPASGKIDGTPNDAGTAQVMLSVSDRFGITAKSAVIPLRITARPEIGRLRQSHGRWREGRKPAKISRFEGRRQGRLPPVGTTFSFKLNANATVTLAFARRKKGRQGRRSASPMLSFAGHPGTNRVAFQGRLSHHRRLRPGPYSLTATASAGGTRSKPRSLRFTIVR
ncbi:MAG TPA: putative Ig domain-containing protein [Solirubrobacterales bacterium]